MKKVNYTISWNPLTNFRLISHLVQNDVITFDVITILNRQYPLFFKEILKFIIIV